MDFTVEAALTLDDVANRFEQWRSVKRQGQKIPAELWELAKPLKGSYKIGHIAQRLHVSTSQMRREGLIPPSTRKKRQSSENKKFVNIPIASILPPAGSEFQSSVVLKRADGMQLTLTQPSTEHLALFIKSFIS